ncbi:MAG TPA: hypothetical protein VIH61_09210 [Waddliaceae bacterium]
MSYPVNNGHVPVGTGGQFPQPSRQEHTNSTTVIVVDNRRGVPARWNQPGASTIPTIPNHIQPSYPHHLEDSNLTTIVTVVNNDGGGVPARVNQLVASAFPPIPINTRGAPRGDPGNQHRLL